MKLEFEGEEIYFAELSNHLLPGGLGMGTFQQDSATVSEGSNLTSNFGPSQTKVNEAPLGSLVRYVPVLALPSVLTILDRYSRWGLRIQCSSLPNAEQNM